MRVVQSLFYLKMNQKVVIIGAGLTGLVTAFYLKRKGIDFVLLEKSDRAGGVMQTGTSDGFIYEKGPSSGMINSPEIIELFEDLKFTDHLLVGNSKTKSRWIWYENRWEPLPTSLITAIKTPLFTWRDKIGMIFEPFRKKGTNPNETLSEMVLRRLGKSYLENAVDPFLGGIYAGDTSRIVTKYALPKLYNLEQKYGSFIVGAIKKAKEPKTEREKKVTKEIFKVKGGFSNFITRLVEEIGRENIVLNCETIEINCESNIEQKYTVTVNQRNQESTIWNTENVVTTIPSVYLNHILPFINKELLAQITSIRYAPIIQVGVAFEKWSGVELNAFGGLISSHRNKPVLGVLFPSSIFPETIPNKESALLSVFMSGIRRQDIFEWSDEKIKNTLKEELTELFQLSDYNPKFVKIFRYKYGIAQYEAETEERLKAIAKLEEQFKGLFLAGNLKDGIGMGNRIEQGVNLAKKIEEITLKNKNEKR